MRTRWLYCDACQEWFDRLWDNDVGCADADCPLAGEDVEPIHDEEAQQRHDQRRKEW